MVSPFYLFRRLNPQPYQCLSWVVLCFASLTAGYAQEWKALTPPESGALWVQPAQGKAAQPVWGHADGLRVGLAPMPGPRGLLRIYTPYLGHKKGKMINFIAIEPVPEGTDKRGFSELEMSSLDNKRGKRFWSANDSLHIAPAPPHYPARGVVSREDGSETLTVYIFSEPFENGAKVYLRLRFYEGRPYEVELATFAREDSRKLKNLIITATMGNYARLRTLHLKDGTKSSRELWPDYTENGFAPHAHFPAGDFISDDKGGVYFVASPDEEHPRDAEYAPGTNDHWKYYGKVATQYWYCKNPGPRLEGLVNGRFTYWASDSPIPGGISFENFELKAPFTNGTRFVFGITPASPEAFIGEVKK